MGSEQSCTVNSADVSEDFYEKLLRCSLRQFSYTAACKSKSFAYSF